MTAYLIIIGELYSLSFACTGTSAQAAVYAVHKLTTVH
jgi:hypothetical protein